MTETVKGALQVEIREVGEEPYLGKRVRAPMAEVGKRVQETYALLYQRLQASGVQPSGPPFLVAEAPKDGFLEMELGAPCLGAPPAGDGYLAGTLPAGRVAVAVHRGSYDTIGEVYRQLQEWITAQGLTPAGPPREVYLTPPGGQQVTEVVWPIR